MPRNRTRGRLVDQDEWEEQKHSEARARVERFTDAAELIPVTEFDPRPNAAGPDLSDLQRQYIERMNSRR